VVLQANSSPVKIALIGKPTGGDRPTASLPTLHRIWNKAKRPSAQAWESDHAGPWNAATKGDGASTVAYSSELDMEFSRMERLRAASHFVDFEEIYEHIDLQVLQFYDHMDLQVLTADGIEHKRPLPMLLLAAEACLQPRVIVKDGATRAGVQVANSILVCCAQATSLAKLCFFTPIARTLDLHPRVVSRQFTDDMLSQAIGGWLGTIRGQASAFTNVGGPIEDQEVCDLSQENTCCPLLNQCGEEDG
jgi:hypothetical protein